MQGSGKEILFSNVQGRPLAYFPPSLTLFFPPTIQDLLKPSRGPWFEHWEPREARELHGVFEGVGRLGHGWMGRPCAHLVRRRRKEEQNKEGRKEGKIGRRKGSFSKVGHSRNRPQTRTVREINTGPLLTRAHYTSF
jgi:hypothetical protein